MSVVEDAQYESMTHINSSKAVHKDRIGQFANMLAVRIKDPVNHSEKVCYHREPNDKYYVDMKIIALSLSP